MTPDEFDRRQRQLEAHVAEQTELLRGIRQDIKILGWVIFIVVMLILGISLK